MDTLTNMTDTEKQARQMLIDGKDWDEIREKTRLREKDLKRIQREITSHF